jgi:hypothetical protein
LQRLNELALFLLAATPAPAQVGLDLRDREVRALPGADVAEPGPAGDELVSDHHPVLPGAGRDVRREASVGGDGAESVEGVIQVAAGRDGDVGASA